MDEEDDVALKQINATLPKGVPECSEDLFEEVMNFFEETAQNKQPFAAVDSPPVLPLDELEEQFDDTISSEIRTYAKFIYEHWHVRRSATGNRGLSPRLKFETGQDTDDADPYVCFRRRELRQIRKTRNRDAQSAEKLRKMRKELEDARQLLAMVKQREMIRKEVLNIDRALFQQRAEVKETKRKLGIKGDDEDLVNQKVVVLHPSGNMNTDLIQPKKRIADFSPGQQALQQQLRLPIGRGGPGEDLRLLEDVQAEKQKAIEREIEQNVQKHIRWNEGFVDKTRAPLTPISPKSFASNSDFRQAMPATEYLPTPPASVSDESPPNDMVADVDASINRVPTPFRYASPSEDDLNTNMPSFRRRIGRGGRLMFDRRIPFRPKEAPNDHIAERYSFDSDDSDAEREIPANDNDTFQMMLHRAYLFAKARDPEMAQAQAVRRAQIEASGGGGHPSAASTTDQQPLTHQQTTS